MSRWMPRLTLALLMLAAVGVFAVGWILSRKERVVVESRDRESLRAFVQRVQAEIRQLEQHYESRLVTSIREVDATDPKAVRHVFDELAGVATCEVRPAGGGTQRVDVDYREFLPVGWIGRTMEGLPDTTGWQRAEEDLLIYRESRGDGVRVTLTVFAPAVERAITAALASMKVDFRRLQAGPGVLDEWLDPTGAAMVAARETAGRFGSPPDVVIPIHSRFGTWEVRSWNGRRRAIEWDTGLQAGAALVSGMLVLGGAGLFAAQRRAVNLAAQRVSFVNRVSHELRTPLTNLLLNLDLVSDDGSLADESRRRLGLIREEADRLSRMVDNVLAFARSEEGNPLLHMTTEDVAQWVRRCAATFDPLLRRRGIALEVRGADRMLAEVDADAFCQIVGNLLSNIEKYALGGAAVIEMAQEPTRVCLSIRDDGPGIAAKDAERVFEPFQRVHGHLTEGVSGTGLGLGIARELARRMGGSLRWVPSEKGACFELCVRRAVEEETE